MNPLETISQIEVLLGDLRDQLEVVEVAPLWVESASELQSALLVGGPIQLADGVYEGNFLITQPTSLWGSRDAVVQAQDRFEPAVQVFSSDVELSGFTVVGGYSDRETLVVGKWDATEVSQQPFRVVLDSLSIKAGPDGGHRGVSLHGSDLTVSNCEITGYFEPDRDSQGIWINNGPGPFLIENNLIEASGENILFGGSDPKIPGVIPSDAVIRGNILRKPQSYKTNGSQVKNSFEVKNARRVLFENNIIDGWWDVIQQAPIQLTPRNQSGTAPWCNVEDITISRTLFQNVEGGFAVNILGTDNENGVSGQTKNIYLLNNMFTGSNALIQVLGGVEGTLTLDGNEARSITKRVFSFDRIAGKSPTVTPLTFTNNIVKSGLYGVTGDGSTSIGLPSLMAFCSLVEWSGNTIEATAQISWPAGQTTVPPGTL
jgi:hypothetical protein